MTSELTAFFDRAQAAERAGDAEAALDYHGGIPMFVRSRHRALLEQLVAASGELTPWIWARWAVYQSIRSEDAGSRTGMLLRAATRDATERFHGDRMDAAYGDGGDPVQVIASVLGESWALHQLAVFEYGVLGSFLDEFAAGPLAEQSELARSWVGAPMGGYLIEGRAAPCTLSVQDPVTDATMEVLDLGAAGLGGWVIGRLVPSGTSPALMFDTAPLPVDETTARQVAARSTEHGGWAGALCDAICAGRLSGADLFREDYELMTDVLSLGLVEFGTRPTDLARVMRDLRAGRDEVGRAAFRILRSASGEELEPNAAPYVAAAVLNVHAYGEAQRTILAAGQQQTWSRWAELVPDPAKRRLVDFAEATAEAA